MPNSPANSGISKPESTNAATSHPNSAPSKRTVNPPTSLSTHAELRHSASSHTSPQTYDTIVEDPLLAQITTSAPRKSCQSETHHLSQRNLSPGSLITGAADLGSGATGMRRSSSGTSVDPPESYAKKEL